MALTITTQPLLDPGELLAWLPTLRGALSWLIDGEGLVGWGEAARFNPRGEARFAQAQQWWSQFTSAVTVRDHVSVRGTGAVAFASMAFADSSEASALIVPKVLIGRRDGTAWITTAGESRTARRPVMSPGNIRYLAGSVDDKAYRRSVAATVARIRAGGLDKVVLARDMIAAAEAPLDERYVLTRLAERYPMCWVFAVNGLLGATPELLLRRDGETVSARVLAGTTWPHADRPAADLSKQLLLSSKNRNEHQFAVRSLADSLRPYCRSLDAAATPSVIHLPNVSHLATDVRGTLAAKASLLELTAHVHPTAATGGTPRQLALQTIADLEMMDRGGYLGPVGWLDANGDGEFGVALRCAQVGASTARLFSGGGIVADSDPDNEQAEVAAKFAVMQFALHN